MCTATQRSEDLPDLIGDTVCHYNHPVRILEKISLKMENLDKRINL